MYIKNKSPQFYILSYTLLYKALILYSRVTIKFCSVCPKKSEKYAQNRVVNKIFMYKT